MLRQYCSAQFLKFLAVGGTAALLHWLARIGLSCFLPFAWAVAYAYCVGMAVAFELNRRYVFPASARPMFKQARDFVLINVGFFPVVWLASLGFRTVLEHIGLRHFVNELAHGAAISIPVFATFLMYKFCAFKDK
ncbi:MAG: hypothetical protein AUJ49_07770 [Desulfovibrionaceae bacterium CG1_02_65_16]|nr:MAG: hypothetical protein AUJ49_07770 [Desulfovibrionaceae bacterium CG1_02_65_16]